MSFSQSPLIDTRNLSQITQSQNVSLNSSSQQVSFSQTLNSKAKSFLSQSEGGQFSFDPSASFLLTPASQVIYDTVSSARKNIFARTVEDLREKSINKALTCEVCGSTDMYQDDNDIYNCNACGTQSNLASNQTQEESYEEDGGGNLIVGKRRTNMTFKRAETEDIEDASIRDLLLNQDNVYTLAEYQEAELAEAERATYVALQVFQAVLLLQAKILVKHKGFHISYVTGVGRVYQMLLQWWRSVGWGKDRNNMVLQFISGKRTFFRSLDQKASDILMQNARSRRLNIFGRFYASSKHLNTMFSFPEYLYNFHRNRINVISQSGMADFTLRLTDIAKANSLSSNVADLLLLRSKQSTRYQIVLRSSMTNNVFMGNLVRTYCRLLLLQHGLRRGLSLLEKQKDVLLALVTVETNKQNTSQGLALPGVSFISLEMDDEDSLVSSISSLLDPFSPSDESPLSSQTSLSRRLTELRLLSGPYTHSASLSETDSKLTTFLRHWRLLSHDLQVQQPAKRLMPQNEGESNSSDRRTVCVLCRNKHRQQLYCPHLQLALEGVATEKTLTMMEIDVKSFDYILHHYQHPNTLDIIFNSLKQQISPLDDAPVNRLSNGVSTSTSTTTSTTTTSTTSTTHSKKSKSTSKSRKRSLNQIDHECCEAHLIPIISVANRLKLLTDNRLENISKKTKSKKVKRKASLRGASENNSNSSSTASMDVETILANSVAQTLSQSHSLNEYTLSVPQNSHFEDGITGWTDYPQPYLPSLPSASFEFSSDSESPDPSSSSELESSTIDWFHSRLDIVAAEKLTLENLLDKLTHSLTHMKDYVAYYQDKHRLPKLETASENEVVSELGTLSNIPVFQRSEPIIKTEDQSSSHNPVNSPSNMSYPVLKLPQTLMSAVNTRVDQILNGQVLLPIDTYDHTKSASQTVDDTKDTDNSNRTNSLIVAASAEFSSEMAEVMKYAPVRRVLFHYSVDDTRERHVKYAHLDRAFEKRKEKAEKREKKKRLEEKQARRLEKEKAIKEKEDADMDGFDVNAFMTMDNEPNAQSDLVVSNNDSENSVDVPSSNSNPSSNSVPSSSSAPSSSSVSSSSSTSTSTSHSLFHNNPIYKYHSENNPFNSSNNKTPSVDHEAVSISSQNAFSSSVKELYETSERLTIAGTQASRRYRQYQHFLYNQYSVVLALLADYNNQRATLDLDTSPEQSPVDQPLYLSLLHEIAVLKYLASQEYFNAIHRTSSNPLPLLPEAQSHIQSLLDTLIEEVKQTHISRNSLQKEHELLTDIVYSSGLSLGFMHLRGSVEKVQATAALTDLKKLRQTYNSIKSNASNNSPFGNEGSDEYRDLFSNNLNDQNQHIPHTQPNQEQLDQTDLQTQLQNQERESLQNQALLKELPTCSLCNEPIPRIVRIIMVKGKRSKKSKSKALKASDTSNTVSSDKSEASQSSSASPPPHPSPNSNNHENVLLCLKCLEIAERVTVIYGEHDCSDKYFLDQNDLSIAYTTNCESSKVQLYTSLLTSSSTASLKSLSSLHSAPTETQLPQHLKSSCTCSRDLTMKNSYFNSFFKYMSVKDPSILEPGVLMQNLFAVILVQAARYCGENLHVAEVNSLLHANVLAFAGQRLMDLLNKIAYIPRVGEKNPNLTLAQVVSQSYFLTHFYKDLKMPKSSAIYLLMEQFQEVVINAYQHNSASPMSKLESVLIDCHQDYARKMKLRTPVFVEVIKIDPRRRVPDVDTDSSLDHESLTNPDNSKPIPNLDDNSNNNFTPPSTTSPSSVSSSMSTSMFPSLSSSSISPSSLLQSTPNSLNSILYANRYSLTHTAETLDYQLKQIRFLQHEYKTIRAWETFRLRYYQKEYSDLTRLRVRVQDYVRKNYKRKKKFTIPKIHFPLGYDDMNVYRRSSWRINNATSQIVSGYIQEPIPNVAQDCATALIVKQYMSENPHIDFNSETTGGSIDEDGDSDTSSDIESDIDSEVAVETDSHVDAQENPDSSVSNFTEPELVPLSFVIIDYDCRIPILTTTDPLNTMPVFDYSNNNNNENVVFDYPLFEVDNYIKYHTNNCTLPEDLDTENPNETKSISPPPPPSVTTSVSPISTLSKGNSHVRARSVWEVMSMLHSHDFYTVDLALLNDLKRTLFILNRICTHLRNELRLNMSSSSSCILNGLTMSRPEAERLSLISSSIHSTVLSHSSLIPDQQRLPLNHASRFVEEGRIFLDKTTNIDRISTLMTQHITTPARSLHFLTNQFATPLPQSFTGLQVLELISLIFTTMLTRTDLSHVRSKYTHQNDLFNFNVLYIYYHSVMAYSAVLNNPTSFPSQSPPVSKTPRTFLKKLHNTNITHYFNAVSPDIPIPILDGGKNPTLNLQPSISSFVHEMICKFSKSYVHTKSLTPIVPFVPTVDKLTTHLDNQNFQSSGFSSPDLPQSKCTYSHLSLLAPPPSHIPEIVRLPLYSCPNVSPLILPPDLPLAMLLLPFPLLLALAQSISRNLMISRPRMFFSPKRYPSSIILSISSVATMLMDSIDLVSTVTSSSYFSSSLSNDPSYPISPLPPVTTSSSVNNPNYVTICNRPFSSSNAWNQSFTALNTLINTLYPRMSSYQQHTLRLHLPLILRLTYNSSVPTHSRHLPAQRLLLSRLTEVYLHLNSNSNNVVTSISASRTPSNNLPVIAINPLYYTPLSQTLLTGSPTRLPLYYTEYIDNSGSNGLVANMLFSSLLELGESPHRLYPIVKTVITMEDAYTYRPTFAPIHLPSDQLPISSTNDLKAKEALFDIDTYWSLRDNNSYPTDTPIHACPEHRLIYNLRDPTVHPRLENIAPNKPHVSQKHILYRFPVMLLTVLLLIPYSRDNISITAPPPCNFPRHRRAISKMKAVSGNEYDKLNFAEIPFVSPLPYNSNVYLQSRILSGEENVSFICDVPMRTIISDSPSSVLINYDKNNFNSLDKQWTEFAKQHILVQPDRSYLKTGEMPILRIIDDVVSNTKSSDERNTFINQYNEYLGLKASTSTIYHTRYEISDSYDIENPIKPFYDIYSKFSILNNTSDNKVSSLSSTLRQINLKTDTLALTKKTSLPNSIQSDFFLPEWNDIMRVVKRQKHSTGVATFTDKYYLHIYKLVKLVNNNSRVFTNCSKTLYYQACKLIEYISTYQSTP